MVAVDAPGVGSGECRSTLLDWAGTDPARCHHAGGRRIWFVVSVVTARLHSGFVWTGAGDGRLSTPESNVYSNRISDLCYSTSVFPRVQAHIAAAADFLAARC